jgi:hypothetical protein
VKSPVYNSVTIISMVTPSALETDIRGTTFKSMLAGYLVALAGFVLLFVGLAKFLPFFNRFAEGRHGELLLPLSVLLICVGGLLRHKAIAKRRRRDGFKATGDS